MVRTGAKEKKNGNDDRTITGPCEHREGQKNKCVKLRGVNRPD